MAWLVLLVWCAHVLLLYVLLGNFDTIPRETADFLAKGPAWVDELRKANENEIEP